MITASCVCLTEELLCWINSVFTAEPAAEGPAHDSQTKLKRARLADNLNERISLRPGPLELVEKNIIPVDSTVKEAAMKGIGAKHSFTNHCKK